MESVGSAGPRGKVLSNQNGGIPCIFEEANSEVTYTKTDSAVNDPSELRDYLGYHKYTRTCFN